MGFGSVDWALDMLNPKNMSLGMSNNLIRQDKKLFNFFCKVGNFQEFGNPMGISVFTWESMGLEMETFLGILN